MEKKTIQKSNQEYDTVKRKRMMGQSLTVDDYKLVGKETIENVKNKFKSIKLFKKKN